MNSKRWVPVVAVPGVAWRCGLGSAVRADGFLSRRVARARSGAFQTAGPPALGRGRPGLAPAGDRRSRGADRNGRQRHGHGRRWCRDRNGGDRGIDRHPRLLEAARRRPSALLADRRANTRIPFWTLSDRRATRARLGGQNQQLTDPVVGTAGRHRLDRGHARRPRTCRSGRPARRRQPATPPPASSRSSTRSAVGLYRRPLIDDENGADLEDVVRRRHQGEGLRHRRRMVLDRPVAIAGIRLRNGPARTVPKTPANARRSDRYEYASRLAYFIWDAPPDDMLTDRRRRERLSRRDQAEAQIARMLQDQRFYARDHAFYSPLAQSRAFARAGSGQRSGFDHNVVEALSTSLLMSATQLYASAARTSPGLFSGRRTT